MSTEHGHTSGTMDLTRLTPITHVHGSIRQADFVDRIASRDVWYRLVRRGILIETHPRVARRADLPTPERHLAEAAAIAAGSTALVAGPTALSVWLGDSLDPSEQIHIITRRRTRRPTLAGVVIHRPTFDADLGSSNRDHLRLTSPLRALVDTAAWEPDRVRSMTERLVLQGLVTPQSLDALAARHGRRGHPGVRRLRLELADWSLDQRPPESLLEVRMMRLLRRYRLPTATFQHVVGRFRLDVTWPMWRAAVECDGFEFHGGRESFERDRERDATLAANGWVVWRYTWRQITQRESWVADHLGQALARRRADLLGHP